MSALLRPRLAALLVLAGLAGCAAPKAPAPPSSTPAPPPLTAPYAAAAAASRPVYRLDRSASQVLVLVGKAGPLSGFGHVHAVVAGGVSGFALLAGGGGRADLRFPVASLQVDPPAVRRSLGGDYAKTLDASARKGTREHMLGKSVLDAARYPWVALAVSPATGDNPAEIDIRVTLHGETRTLAAPVQTVRNGGVFAADGRFTIKQTAFGITPYSVALGGLRVKDALDIRYHLVFRRWCGEDMKSGKNKC